MRNIFRNWLAMYHPVSWLSVQRSLTALIDVLGLSISSVDDLFCTYVSHMGSLLCTSTRRVICHLNRAVWSCSYASCSCICSQSILASLTHTALRSLDNRVRSAILASKFPPHSHNVRLFHSSIVIDSTVDSTVNALIPVPWSWFQFCCKFQFQFRWRDSVNRFHHVPF